MATVTPSSTSINETNSSLPSLDKKPKRIILRLRVDEFEGEDRSWQQHVDAIRAYLIWAGRPIGEHEGPYETRKHYAHVEPFQAPELKQKTFHVILDMEQDMLGNPNFDDVHHEVYRVRRDQAGNLYDLKIHQPDQISLLLIEKSARFKIHAKQRR